jgi:hypothetical protein
VEFVLLEHTRLEIPSEPAWYVQTRVPAGMLVLRKVQFALYEEMAEVFPTAY